MILKKRANASAKDVATKRGIEYFGANSFTPVRAYKIKETREQTKPKEIK